MSPTREDFSALLDESLGGRDFMEGQVVQGKVVAIEKDLAIIDVGLKNEGSVSLKEFGDEEGRSEERRVGKEDVRTWRDRWWRDHKRKRNATKKRTHREE